MLCVHNYIQITKENMRNNTFNENCFFTSSLLAKLLLNTSFLQQNSMLCVLLANINTMKKEAFHTTTKTNIVKSQCFPSHFTSFSLYKCDLMKRKLTTRNPDNSTTTFVYNKKQHFSCDFLST